MGKFGHLYFEATYVHEVQEGLSDYHGGGFASNCTDLGDFLEAEITEIRH